MIFSAAGYDVQCVEEREELSPDTSRNSSLPLCGEMSPHHYGARETCSLTTHSSVVSISWYRGDSLLVTGLEDRLEQDNISLAEGGEWQYRCHVQTQLDEAEAVRSVAVLRPTSILSRYQDIHITQGSQATITCSASLDHRLSQNSTTILIKEKFLIEPQSEKVDLFLAFQHFHRNTTLLTWY